MQFELLGSFRQRAKGFHQGIGILTSKAKVTYRLIDRYLIAENSHRHEKQHRHQHGYREPAEIDEPAQDDGEVDADEWNIEQRVGDHRDVVSE